MIEALINVRFHDADAEKLSVFRDKKQFPLIDDIYPVSRDADSSQLVPIQANCIFKVTINDISELADFVTLLTDTYGAQETDTRIIMAEIEASKTTA